MDAHAHDEKKMLRCPVLPGIVAYVLVFASLDLVLRAPTQELSTFHIRSTPIFIPDFCTLEGPGLLVRLQTSWKTHDVV